MGIVFFNASVVLAGFKSPKGGSGKIISWAKTRKIRAWQGTVQNMSFEELAPDLPEGYMAVGAYGFKPPFVPTITQVEEAEEFIFTNPIFADLTEEHRRRNVIRLAMNISIIDPQVVESPIPRTDKITSMVVLTNGIIEINATMNDGVMVREYRFEPFEEDNGEA